MEISGSDLRKYSESNKNCAFAKDGCTLSPGSIVKFSLDKPQIILKLKRNFGSDGIIIINDNKYIINPGIHILRINNSNINITKPNNTIGRISITEIFLEEQDKNNNWQQIIKKFNNITGIKLVDNELYASENAKISGAQDILQIDTSPPNSYIRANNDIIFVNFCKINEIKFKEKILDIQGFQQMNYVPDKNDLVYDSGKLDINGIENIEGFIETKDGITVGFDASFTHKLFGLEEKKDYIVSVAVSVQNGNGKFGIKFCSPDFLVQSDFIGIARTRCPTDICIKVNTSVKLENDLYYLHIYRPKNSSTGAIVVHGIRVFKPSLKTDNVLKSIEVVDKFFSAQKIDQKIIDDKYHSYKYYVRESSRENAVLDLDKIENVKTDNISVIFELNTLSSRQWFNKINSFLPNIKPKYSGYRFYNMESCATEPNLVFCSANKLKSSKRIFVEEFSPNNISDLSILKNCDEIITPSLANKFHIQNLTGKEAKVIGRLWPKIDIPKEQGDYILYFEKNPQTTELLIHLWKDKPDNLYIIGSNERSEFGGNIKHYNSYISYKEIFKLLINCKRLLDISDCHDYISGIIELANGLGVPVITNNHYYFNNAVIIRNDQAGLLQHDIEEALEKENKPIIKEYNFLENIKELLC